MHTLVAIQINPDDHIGSLVDNGPVLLHRLYKRFYRLIYPIPDHLAWGLDVLFIGFNPSPRSGETGHHYANPRNHFWTILNRAGLTPRMYRAEEDRELLKLGCGFTNIVARPTPTAADITADDYAEGRKRLHRKIETFRPHTVCFVGIYAQLARQQQQDGQ